MFIRLIKKATYLPIMVHIGAVCAFSFGLRWVGGKLDASYLASNHPVDYATGQTAFNGEVIKGYYQHMLDAGGLEIYWATQFIDFGFIAAIFGLGLFVAAFIARLAPLESKARTLAFWAGAALMAGASFDVTENLISFIMLSNPTGFANWIAYPYSAAATIKFALIAAGIFGLIGAIVVNVVGRILGLRKPT